MEKIGELDYKDFKTEFFVTDRVREYLDENNISFDEILDDEYHWYEIYLFENLDENQDGIPDDKFGRNFRVIYYGVIIRKNEDGSEEGFEDRLDCEEEKLIGDWIKVVSEQAGKRKSFAIKSKVLMA